jgi:hypothetical protein
MVCKNNNKINQSINCGVLADTSYYETEPEYNIIEAHEW